MKKRELKLRTKAPLLLGVLTALIAGLAHSQDNFYAGKTITLVAFTAPGGSGDLRVKAAVPFIKKHIPGNPTIVIEYMDGGGGRKGVNHLFHSARPDGLTIGGGSGAIVALGIMRDKASPMMSTSSFISALQRVKTTPLSTRERNLG
jgi:tripartite-type tricarboxylate transporter receptor subunit TctC